MVFMKQELLEATKRELINGFTKKKHPFRYFSLATVGADGKPHQRTVVLRKMDSNFNLMIYTDTRSHKIKDIERQPEVSALFYHPKKLLQIRVEGTAHQISDSEVLEDRWHAIPENSRKDYITVNAPGSPIGNPDQVNYNTNKGHFSIIEIIPHTIEYLQLKRPNHIRVEFNSQGKEWKGKFLVP